METQDKYTQIFAELVEQWNEKRDERLDNTGEYESGEPHHRCFICGALLGENNHTYLGGTCRREIYNPAVFEFLKENELAQQIWKEKIYFPLWQSYVTPIRNFWLSLNEKDGQPKKFRSEFKKEFYNSMKTSERISRKQVDIMVRDLENYVYYNQYNEHLLKEVPKTDWEEFKPGFDKLIQNLWFYANEMGIEAELRSQFSKYLTDKIITKYCKNKLEKALKEA